MRYLLAFVLSSAVPVTKPVPTCHRVDVCARWQLYCNGHPYTGGSCGGVQLVCVERRITWECN